MQRLGTLLVIAAMACGRPSSVAYSELDQEMQQARCGRLVRCKLFPDEASCHAYSRATSDPSVSAAIAAHKIDYDGERARQCVDAIASQSCDLTAHDAHIPPSACSEMFTGRVADGEACSIDVECASGTCDLPMSCPEMGCCFGICRATQTPGKVGDACAKLRDCKTGLVCGQDLTCHAPAGVGEACGSDRECVDGLACVGAGSTPGTCRALPHAGELCSYQRCADENLRCDENTHTCVPVGLPGDPCPTSTECAIGMECDATTHLCREYPTLGMPCNGTCVGDSFCRFDASGGPGTCVALLANNSPCDGNQQCASTFCEDGPVFRSCIDPYKCF